MATESALSPGAVTPVTEPVQPTNVSQVLESLVEQFASQQAIATFRQNTTWQRTVLQSRTAGQGYNNELPASVDIGLPNNGLSVYLGIKHVTTITVANTNATAETLNISPWFPYNLYASNQLSINGQGNSPHAVSSLGDLMVAVRSKLASLVKGERNAPPNAFVSVVFNSLTPTASTLFSLSGYQSVSVAASTTGTIVVTWYEKHKLAYSRLNPMGTIPLNNTQLNAVFTKTQAPAYTSQTNASVALYNVPNGVNITVQDTLYPTYYYWATPQDPSVYAKFVSQVYIVSEQSNITTNATGQQAFQYNLPLSQYITALHTFWTDGNGNPLTIYSNVDNINLWLAAGTVRPVVFDTGTHQFEQALDYGQDFSVVPGYLLWDGNDTAELPMISDDTGWFNTYNASNPALVADIIGNPALPVKTRVVRESLVDGTIQTYTG